MLTWLIATEVFREPHVRNKGMLHTGCTAETAKPSPSHGCLASPKRPHVHSRGNNCTINCTSVNVSVLLTSECVVVVKPSARWNTVTQFFGANFKAL
jgi:hypothetical protein